MLRFSDVNIACSNPAPRALALALAGLVGASIGACTKSLDFTECTEHADCDRFVDEDGPLRCETGVCVKATCAEHSECTTLGGSQVCGIDGVCVDALSDACEFLVLPGGEVGDKLTLLGAVIDASTPGGKLASAAFKLAVEDFNSATALANGDKFGLVLCDSGGEISAARSNAARLVEEVGIAALLGPMDDDAFVTVAKDVVAKMGNFVFTMSPTATAPIGFEDSGVLWRATPGAAAHATALRDRIKGDEPESAIMLLRGNNYGIGIYQELTVESGMDRVIPNVPIQAILSYETLDEGRERLATLAMQVSDPTALILIGGDEVGELILKSAELGLAPKKIYTSHAGLRGIQSAIIQSGDADLMASIEMIAPLAEHPENAPILYQRLQAASPGLVLGTEAPLAYDAAMSTMLAIAATPGSTLTGPTIAPQMSKLVGGAPVSFGDVEDTAIIRNAVSALTMGDAIDVVGTSGDLRFQQESGEPCGPFQALHFADLANPLPIAAATYNFACPMKTGAWE